MADPVSPDTGEVLRLFLRSQSLVTGITGTRVATSLTGTSPAIRYVLVSGGNLGGGAVWARYQVECWGWGGGKADDGTSDLLARNVISVAPDMNGMIGGARVSGAAAAYHRRADDAATNRPRNIVEVAFTAAPEEG